MRNVYIFFLIFLGACNLQPKSTKLEITGESIKLKEFRMSDELLEDSTILKKCQIVILETNNESLIKGISRIYKTDNNIFIFDKSLNKIFIFDSSGKYINQIHNIGQGPLEYISLMDFCLDEKKEEIVLLCDRPSKIMRFTYDGKFADQINIPDFFRNIVMESDYVYCNRSELNKTDLDEYEICCMKRSGIQVSNQLKSRNNIENTVFNPGNFLNKSDHIYYTRRFDNIIYQVKKNNIVAKYMIDFGKFNLPSNLIEIKDTKSFIDECKTHKYIYSITEFVEKGQFILFKTNVSICVYNKNNNTFIGYPGIQICDLNIGSNSFYTNGSDINSIIIKLEPHTLYFLEEHIENENLKNLLKKVKNDDNPILITYELI